MDPDNTYSNYIDSINDIDCSIANLRHIEDYVSLLYQENSKWNSFSILRQRENISKFATPYMLNRSSQPYKAFPTKRTISIREYESTGENIQADLFKTIANRRSQRIFADYMISLNELGKLLHFSYGITCYVPKKGTDGEWAYRAVPSGGALYPLEIYVYLNNSVLPKGLYHFRADISALEVLEENDLLDKLKRIIVAEPIVELSKCSCVFFISSVCERTLLKYGDRGYRFILQEVGFVGQNISLVSGALGLSSCMCGSFIDDEVNKLIQADGTNETIQSIIGVGKYKEK